MDSGNSSGSLQSSSGGGDEDSSSFSAFLNNNPPPPAPTPTHVGVVGPFNTSTSHTHMFDPLSNYLDPTQRSHPSLLNLDMMWSKPGRSEPNRSEPNPTYLAHLLPCSSPPSSSSSPHNQQAFLSTQLQAGETRGSTTCSAFLDTHHILPPESGSRGLLSVSAATKNDDQANNNVVRNPKKRSRASRRAPTTVLTTDTTNFRAMVQEFTGIPAPFTSSPFPRTRFDLFPPPLHAATTPSTTLLDPPYLLRPFAQKLQQQQHHHLHPFPPPSSSMVETLLASNNNSTNSTSINYRVSSSDDHSGLMKQPPLLNFNSMHNNSILSFQNILQQSPNYPIANSSSVLASKTQQQQQQLSLEITPPSGADSHLKMGVLEELGLRHAHVNNTNVSSNLRHHHNMVSRGNNSLSTANASSMEWAQRTSIVTNNDCGHGGGRVLRPDLTLSGTVTNGKVHYSSASSSDFHGEKGLECTTTVAAARSEGMVESWINCSSD